MASTFQPDRLVEYSDRAILAEIRRVAALFPSPELTLAQFRQHGKVSATTIRRRFGTWQRALEWASLANRYCGPEITQKMRVQLARRMKDEELLEELRLVAERIGRVEITVEEFNASARIDADAIRGRFGSWPAGLQRAGLRTVNLGTQIKNASRICERFGNIMDARPIITRCRGCRPPSGQRHISFVGAPGISPCKRSLSTWQRRATKHLVIRAVRRWGAR